MTIKQQRVGRLQKEGFLKYGADASWTRTGGYNKRPLACEEISKSNQGDHKTMCHSLAHSMCIPRRTNVGCKHDKTKSVTRLSINLFLDNKNGRIFDNILALEQKKFRI